MDPFRPLLPVTFGTRSGYGDSLLPEATAPKAPSFLGYKDWQSAEIADNGFKTNPEAGGTDELRKVSRYSDYVREQFLSAGAYSIAAETDIRKGVAGILFDQGLTKSEDLRQATETGIFSSTPNSFETNLQVLKAGLRVNDPEYDAVSQYLAERKVAETRGAAAATAEDSNWGLRYEALREDVEKISQSPEVLNKARRRLLSSGEAKFIEVFDNSGDPTGMGPWQPRLEVGDGAEQDAQKEILKSVKAGLLPAARAYEALELTKKIPGLDIPVYKAERAQEIEGMIETFLSGPKGVKYETVANDLAQKIADIDSGRAAQKETSGLDVDTFATALSLEFEKSGMMPAGMELSSAEVSQALKKYGARRALSEGRFEFYDEEGSIGNNIRVHEDGTIFAHPALLANRDLYQKALKEKGDSLTETQRTMLDAQRNRVLTAGFDQYNELLQRAPGGISKEWAAFRNKGMAEGKANSEILESFLANPKNFNEVSARLGGVGQSVLDGVGELFAFIPAASGADWATEYLADNSQRRSDRREVARLFGTEFGMGQDIAEAIAPMVTDLAATALLAPVSGGMSTLGFIAKQGGKISAKNITKTVVGRTLMQQAGETAEKAGMRAQLAGAIKESVSVDDATKLIEDYSKLMASNAATMPALFVTAGTRSGAGAYGAVYNTLRNDPNNKMSPEEMHQAALGAGLTSAAITAVITTGFSLIGKGGVDDLILSGASKAQVKSSLSILAGVDDITDEAFNGVVKSQLNNAIQKLGLDSAKRIALPESIKSGIDEAIEEGLDQFVNSWVDESFTGEERMPLLERLKQTMHAAAIGGVLGTGMTATMTGARKLLYKQEDLEAYTLRKAQDDFVNSVAAELESTGSPTTAGMIRTILGAGARGRIRVAEGYGDADNTISRDQAVKVLMAKPEPGAEVETEAPAPIDPMAPTAPVAVNPMAPTAKVVISDPAELQSRLANVTPEEVHRAVLGNSAVPGQFTAPAPAGATTPEGTRLVPQAVIDWDTENANPRQRRSKWVGGSMDSKSTRELEVLVEAASVPVFTAGTSYDDDLSGTLAGALNWLSGGPETTAQMGLPASPLTKMSTRPGLPNDRLEGPFLFMANTTMLPDGKIKTPDQVGAILVNSANAGQLEAIREAVQEVRPDIFVGMHSDATFALAAIRKQSQEAYREFEAYEAKWAQKGNTPADELRAQADTDKAVQIRKLKEDLEAAVTPQEESVIRRQLRDAEAAMYRPSPPRETGVPDERSVSREETFHQMELLFDSSIDQEKTQVLSDIKRWRALQAKARNFDEVPYYQGLIDDANLRLRGMESKLFARGAAQMGYQDPVAPRMERADELPLGPAVQVPLQGGGFARNQTATRDPQMLPGTQFLQEEQLSQFTTLTADGKEAIIRVSRFLPAAALRPVEYEVGPRSSEPLGSMRPGGQTEKRTAYFGEDLGDIPARDFTKAPPGNLEISGSERIIARIREVDSEIEQELTREEFQQLYAKYQKNMLPSYGGSPRPFHEIYEEGFENVDVAIRMLRADVLAARGTDMPVAWEAKLREVSENAAQLTTVADSYDKGLQHTLEEDPQGRAGFSRLSVGGKQTNIEVRRESGGKKWTVLINGQETKAKGFDKPFKTKAEALKKIESNPGTLKAAGAGVPRQVRAYPSAEKIRSLAEEALKVKFPRGATKMPGPIQVPGAPALPAAPAAPQAETATEGTATPAPAAPAPSVANPATAAEPSKPVPTIVWNTEKTVIKVSFTNKQGAFVTYSGELSPDPKNPGKQKIFWGGKSVLDRQTNLDAPVIVKGFSEAALAGNRRSQLTKVFSEETVSKMESGQELTPEDLGYEAVGTELNQPGYVVIFDDLKDKAAGKGTKVTWKDFNGQKKYRGPLQLVVDLQKTAKAALGAIRSQKNLTAAQKKQAEDLDLEIKDHQFYIDQINGLNTKEKFEAAAKAQQNLDREAANASRKTAEPAEPQAPTPSTLNDGESGQLDVPKADSDEMVPDEAAREAIEGIRASTPDAELIEEAKKRAPRTKVPDALKYDLQPGDPIAIYSPSGKLMTEGLFLAYYGDNNEAGYPPLYFMSMSGIDQVWPPGYTARPVEPGEMLLTRRNLPGELEVAATNYRLKEARAKEQLRRAARDSEAKRKAKYDKLVTPDGTWTESAWSKFVEPALNVASAPSYLDPQTGELLLLGEAKPKKGQKSELVPEYLPKNWLRVPKTVARLQAFRDNLQQQVFDRVQKAMGREASKNASEKAFAARDRVLADRGAALVSALDNLLATYNSTLPGEQRRQFDPLSKLDERVIYVDPTVFPVSDLGRRMFKRANELVRSGYPVSLSNGTYGFSAPKGRKLTEFSALINAAISKRYPQLPPPALTDVEGVDVRIIKGGAVLVGGSPFFDNHPRHLATLLEMGFKDIPIPAEFPNELINPSLKVFKSRGVRYVTNVFEPGKKLGDPRRSVVDADNGTKVKLSDPSSDGPVDLTSFNTLSSDKLIKFNSLFLSQDQARQVIPKPAQGRKTPREDEPKPKRLSADTVRKIKIRSKDFDEDRQVVALQSMKEAIGELDKLFNDFIASTTSLGFGDSKQPKLYRNARLTTSEVPRLVDILRPTASAGTLFDKSLGMQILEEGSSLFRTEYETELRLHYLRNQMFHLIVTGEDGNPKFRSAQAEVQATNILISHFKGADLGAEVEGADRNQNIAQELRGVMIQNVLKMGTAAEAEAESEIELSAERQAEIKELKGTRDLRAIARAFIRKEILTRDPDVYLTYQQMGFRIANRLKDQYQIRRVRNVVAKATSFEEAGEPGAPGLVSLRVAYEKAMGDMSIREEDLVVNPVEQELASDAAVNDASVDLLGYQSMQEGAPNFMLWAQGRMAEGPSIGLEGPTHMAVPHELVDSIPAEVENLLSPGLFRSLGSSLMSAVDIAMDNNPELREALNQAYIATVLGGDTSEEIQKAVASRETLDILGQFGQWYSNGSHNGNDAALAFRAQLRDWRLDDVPGVPALETFLRALSTLDHAVITRDPNGPANAPARFEIDPYADELITTIIETRRREDKDFDAAMVAAELGEAEGPSPKQYRLWIMQALANEVRNVLAANSYITKAEQGKAERANANEARALGIQDIRWQGPTVELEYAGIRQVLLDLSQKTNYPLSVRIAARLIANSRGLLEDVPIRFIREDSLVAGRMVTNADGSRVVEINLRGSNKESMASVIVHEYLHAMLTAAINADPATLTPQQRAALAEIRRVYDLIKKAADANPDLSSDPRLSDGLVSIDEFVSYFFTSTAFQSKVRQLGVATKQRNWIQRVVESIMDFLGIPRANHSDAAFKALLDFSYAVAPPSSYPTLQMAFADAAVNASYKTQQVVARAREFEKMRRVERTEADSESSAEVPKDESPIKKNRGVVPEEMRPSNKRRDQLDIAIWTMIRRVGRIPDDVKVVISREKPKAMWVDITGTMFVNPDRMGPALQTIPEAGKAEVIQKIVEEETDHIASIRAVTPEQFKAYLDKLTDEQLEETARDYHGDPGYKLPENPKLREQHRVQLAEERIRRIKQQVLTGSTTEDTIAFWRSNPGATKIMVHYLKNTIHRFDTRKRNRAKANKGGGLTIEEAVLVDRMTSYVRLLKAGFRMPPSGGVYTGDDLEVQAAWAVTQLVGKPLSEIAKPEAATNEAEAEAAAAIAAEVEESESDNMEQRPMFDINNMGYAAPMSMAVKKAREFRMILAGMGNMPQAATARDLVNQYAEAPNESRRALIKDQVVAGMRAAAQDLISPASPNQEAFPAVGWMIQSVANSIEAQFDAIGAGGVYAGDWDWSGIAPVAGGPTDILAQVPEQRELGLEDQAFEASVESLATALIFGPKLAGGKVYPEERERLMKLARRIRMAESAGVDPGYDEPTLYKWAKALFPKPVTPETVAEEAPATPPEGAAEAAEQPVAKSKGRKGKSKKAPETSAPPVAATPAESIDEIIGFAFGNGYDPDSDIDIEDDGTSNMILATSFGAVSDIPVNLDKGTRDYSPFFSLLNLPVMELGTYKAPSNFFMKLIKGEFDPRVRRIVEFKNMFEKSNAALLKDYKRAIDTVIAEDFTGPEEIAAEAAAASGTSEPTFTKEAWDKLEGRYLDELSAIQIDQADVDQLAAQMMVSDPSLRRIDAAKAARESLWTHYSSAVKQRRDDRERRIRKFLSRQAKARRDAALTSVSAKSPRLAALLIDLRRLTDEMSKRAGEILGEKNPRLELTFDSQMGIYVTRSYKMFDDAEYREAITTPKMQQRLKPEMLKILKAADDFFEAQFVKFRTELYLKDGESKDDAERMANEDLNRRQVNGRSFGEDARIDFLMSYGDRNISTKMMPSDPDFIRMVDSNLKRRKALPKEIRDLLGEYGAEEGANILLNTFATVSGLLAHTNLLYQMKTLGGKDPNGLAEQWLYSPAEIEELGGGGGEAGVNRGMSMLYQKGFAQIQLASGTNSSYNVLAGYFAPTELVEAIRRAGNSLEKDLAVDASRTTMQQIMRGASWATGTVLGIKVLGSVGHYFRGAISQPIMAAAQGRPFLSKLGHNLISEIKEIPKGMRLKSDELIELKRLEWIQVGILEEGVRSGVLKDLIYGKRTPYDLQKEAADIYSRLPESAKRGTVLFAQAAELGTRLEAATEAFYKIAYYEDTLEVLKKARAAGTGKIRGVEISQMSDEDLKREAAEQVRSTAPTHSRTLPIVRGFTKSAPGLLLGAFMRWNSEMIRTPVNTALLARDEILSGNPVLRVRGAQRALGLSTVIILSGAALPILSQLLAGIDDEEDEALRSAMPEYLRDHSFLFWDRGGKLQSYDFTYLNPFSQLTDPWVRSFYDLTGRDGDLGKAVSRLVTAGFTKVFLNDQILAGVIQDVMANTNSTTGQPITLEGIDNVGESALKKISYIAEKAFAPRLLADTYDAIMASGKDGTLTRKTPGSILMSGVYPMKPYPVDVEASMRRYLFEAQQKYDIIGRNKYKAMSDSPMGPEDMKALYEYEVEMKRRINRDVHLKMQAFIRMGVPIGKAVGQMEEFRYGRDRTRMVLAGTMPKPELSEKYVQGLLSRPYGPDRLQALIKEQQATPAVMSLKD